MPRAGLSSGTSSGSAASTLEGFTRLTWEIEEAEGGVTRLTVVHDLEGAPKLAHMVAGGLEDVGAGGGWSWILSDLKTLLETGESCIHKA